MFLFKIPSMNCMSCYWNILDVLEERDSAVKASVDFESKQLTVESARTFEEVKLLIEDAGYPVAEGRQQ